VPPVTQSIVCAKVIPLFRKKYPNIIVNIYEEGAALASELLNDGKIDFGFLTLFRSEPKLDGFIIYEGSVVAIMDKNHPLSSKQYITPQDLSQYDIIGLDQNFTLYSMIDVYMNNSRIKLKYFYLTGRWDYAIQMILKNDYNFIAILPNDIINVFSEPRLTYRKFERKFLWQVMLNYRKDKLMRPEMILFKEFVKDFFNIA
jgi:DNA-binding transcriptional LysR family regulator